MLAHCVFPEHVHHRFAHHILPQLENLRMNQRLVYRFNIDSELAEDGVGIPPMLIQPLVENAVIHGIKPKDGKGIISIHFSKETFRFVRLLYWRGPGKPVAFLALNEYDTGLI